MLEESIEPKKRTDIIKISIIQFTLVLICFILSNILGTIMNMMIYTSKKFPSNFAQMSLEDRNKKAKEVEVEFNKTLREKPELIEKEFHSTLFKESPSLLLLLNLIWFISYVVVGYIGFRFLLKEPYNDLSDELNSTFILKGIGSAFYIFLVLILVSIFLKLIKFQPKTSLFQHELFSNLKGNWYLLLWGMYTVGLITGILEEVFFRGYLLNQYIQNGYPREGLLITSVLFGSLHYTKDSSLLVPFIITIVGFILGGLYLQFKNIWVSISAHATYNSLILLGGYFFGDSILK
jgi:hypothetical protein